MILKGKTALVTGGSRGLGRATALALAEAGSDVLVNYRESAAAAAEVVEIIRGLGRRAEMFQADVSKADEVSQMAGSIFANFGEIHILVNNAGRS